MRRLIMAALAAQLTAGTAAAAWNDAPWTNRYWWEESRSNDVWGQLWSGVVERAEAVGVSTPTNVETWTVFWGTSNTVVTNGGFVYTNESAVTTNITTTNLLGQHHDHELARHVHLYRAGRHRVYGIPVHDAGVSYNA
jgi:hypothetical protein